MAQDLSISSLWPTWFTETNVLIWVTLLLGFCIILQLFLTLYSLYLGPLSNIPGPKLAAATYLYEAYYDVYHSGLYWQEIREMHKHYGPIVRVNPEEVHCDDADFYNKLYNNTGKWNKDERAAGQFFGRGSIASTVSHEVHQGRRSVLNAYFSRTNVHNLQPNIKFHLEKLCRRIREFAVEGTPVPLNVAFAALGADIVTNYLMPQPYYLLDVPGFSPSYYWMMRAGSEYSQMAKNFTWAYPILERMPRWLGRRISPVGIQTLEDQDFIVNQITKWKGNPNAYTLPDIRYTKGSKGLPDQPPYLANGFLIEHMLNKPLPGPPSEKSFKRLAQEFQILIGAGSDSVTIVLAHIVYYTLSNEVILSKLKAELKEVNTTAGELPDYRELEQLPYLSALISEGLRMSIPNCTRLTRIAPDRALHYKDYLIPAGTTVSMNMADLHLNERYFPDPDTFVPERWLGPNALANKRNFVPFSRGSRNCVAMNLAYAILPLVLAAMFTRFDMELYETTSDDVRFQHDFFTPQPRIGSVGVQVKIRQTVFSSN